MKTYLKILAGLFSVVVLFLSWSFSQYLKNEGCDTITLTGEINSESFVKVRNCLVRSKASKKTFVIEASPGGDVASALAFGILIHRHNWDVEIVDYCASACAAFIFPAGKTKYLNRNAMLMFHGGPHQENLLEMAERFVLVAETEVATAESVTLGQVTKENSVSIAPKTRAYREVQKFLSIPDDSTPAELVRALRKASDQLYQALGINPLLPIYGQIGAHEPTYKSYKYLGFAYGLDSLRRFGVVNIELRQGEWHPQRHPGYKDVYEVTFP